MAQVATRDGDYHVLRVHVTRGEFGFWEDDVLLNHIGERLLDGDAIEFVGVVLGEQSYRTVLGATRTIPDILGLQVIRLSP